MKKIKGFTLVELLAVIIILGVLLIIAVPQVIKVINRSRSNSWSNSVSIVTKAIESNSNLKSSSGSNSAKYKDVTDLCKSTENATTGAFNSITTLGDMTVSCIVKDDYYEFTLKGKNRYKDKQSKVSCTPEGVCYIDSVPPANDNEEVITPITSSYMYVATGGETNSLSSQYIATPGGGYEFIGPKLIYIETSNRNLCTKYGEYDSSPFCFNFNSYDVSKITGKINVNGAKTAALLEELENRDACYNCYNSSGDYIEFSINGSYCSIYKDHYYCTYNSYSCYVSRTQAYCAQ